MTALNGPSRRLMWQSIYTYNHMHIYIYIYTHTLLYVDMSTDVPVHVHKHTLHTYIYICVFIYVYIYIHIRTYIFPAQYWFPLVSSGKDPHSVPLEFLQFRTQPAFKSHWARPPHRAYVGLLFPMLCSFELGL